MTTPVGIPQPSYKKPPIIEAVIAMHFSVPLELKWIEAFTRKRKTRFPNSEDLIEMSASFNAQTHQTASNMKKVGHKLTSVDNTNVITIRPDQLAISHLAPYTDWDRLYSEARGHWNVLAKIAKHKTLSCVSTRYINRIDIPVGINGRVDLHMFFNAGLSLPTYVQEMALQTFHVNCSLLHASEQYKYVLQLASTPSPLIDHLSFTIDIDVMTTGSVPVNEDKMWSLIGSLRKHKNDLFESCITPETRKLFQ
jgi:uncharacterized protein (TIGR04255 family)